jgi:hypothetical protein
MISKSIFKIKDTMIQTVTIDIINDKALKLLRDLELMRLIRMRKEKAPLKATNWAARHKGAMGKQPLAAIDKQLNELRNGWE